jgi:hypothetical protein
MIIKDVNDSQSKLVLRRALFHIICSTCDACDASFTSHDIRSLTETLHFLPYDALMLANFTFICLRPINSTQTYQKLIEKFFNSYCYSVRKYFQMFASLKVFQ